MLAFLLPEDAADIHPCGQVRLHLLFFFFRGHFRTSRGHRGEVPSIVLLNPLAYFNSGFIIAVVIIEVT